MPIVASPEFEQYSSKYKLPHYKSYFCDSIADYYKPKLYSNQCFSGVPDVYYRILAVNSDGIEKLCLQYFYYWKEQICIFSSHTYDYEPIFIYFKRNDNKPYMIVNNGFGSVLCRFHKVEIRPSQGIRSREEEHTEAKITEYPYYPFGGRGDIVIEVCYKIYPLDRDDLIFENSNPLFGIRSCSNVFSGSRTDLQGFIFNPKSQRLTDEILDLWYFHHSSQEPDMPFGHDLADPFTFPYIRFRSAKGLTG
jgi:hypothetical protein